MAYSVAGVLIDETATRSDSIRADMRAKGTNLYIAYEGGVSQAARRIYNRIWNGSAFTGAAVDVSGAGPAIYGYGDPSVAVMDDGRILVGYGVGVPEVTSVGRGLRVKESTDSGATWGNEFTFPLYTSHYFRGLATDGETVYALTQKDPSAGGDVVLHKRTAAGVWTGQTLFSGGNSGSYWALYTRPQQNMVVNGDTICIIGSRAVGAGQKKFNALVGTWGAAFAEVSILSQDFDMKRKGRMQLGTDGVLRGCATSKADDLTTDILEVFYSMDMGSTWTVMSQPTAFTATDSFGTPVVWTPEYFNGDSFSFCLDAGNYWWISELHYDSASVIIARLHRYKSTANSSSSFTLNSSQTLPTSGSATPDNSYLSNWPGPSAFLGRDFYRLICALDSANSYAELWLIKEATIGVLTRGGGSAIATKREA